jgi:hypothetical protein
MVIFALKYIEIIDFVWIVIDDPLSLSKIDIRSNKSYHREEKAKSAFDNAQRLLAIKSSWSDKLIRQATLRAVESN